jgi:DNA-binding NarL/FixJ family response regulator
MTSRQQEVATLLSKGQSMKEIAYTLGISIKTVDSHKCSIYRTLNVHNVAMLTRAVIENEQKNGKMTL